MNLIRYYEGEDTDSSMSAVADTCFIVNWSNFRRSRDLFKYFKTINLPIVVIDEVKDVSVKRFIANWIVKVYKNTSKPTINRYRNTKAY